MYAGDLRAAEFGQFNPAFDGAFGMVSTVSGYQYMSEHGVLRLWGYQLKAASTTKFNADE